MNIILYKPIHYQHLDEDGLASSFLLLTSLLPFALYFLDQDIIKKLHSDCKCNNCTKYKVKTKRLPQILMLFIKTAFWVVISYLIKNILTIQIKNKSLENIFDPYTILNVTQDSSIKEVKKTFCKICKSMQKHNE